MDSVYFPVMRSVLAWVAVNAFFMAICVTFAGVYFGLASIARAAHGPLLEDPSFVLAIGVLAIAATIAVTYKAMQLIGGSPSRGRARGRG